VEGVCEEAAADRSTDQRLDYVPDVADDQIPRGEACGCEPLDHEDEVVHRKVNPPVAHRRKQESREDDRLGQKERLGNTAGEEGREVRRVLVSEGEEKAGEEPHDWQQPVETL
jgi:hypothetical protein